MSDGDITAPSDTSDAATSLPPPPPPRPGTTPNPSSLIYSSDFIKSHTTSREEDGAEGRAAIASDALEFLVGECFEAALKDHHLNLKAQAAAAEFLWEAAFQLASLHRLNHDRLDFKDVTCSHWRPDADLDLPVADAFTRGCIAVTRRSKEFVLGSNLNHGVPTADDARSQGSRTSKRSGKSGTTSESLGGKKGGKKALNDVKVPDTVTEEEKDDKDEFTTRQSAMEEEEEQLRALLRRRAEKEAATEKERLDHEQRSKSIIEALAKVGGKDILLDANGKPIPVSHMEVEKVPSKFVAPKTVCLDPPKEKSDSKPKHSSPKADPPAASTFTPMGTVQPSAIDTLGPILKNGVVLSEGSNKKSGPPRVDDPKHLSLKKFREMFSVETAATRPSTNATDAAKPAAVGRRASVVADIPAKKDDTASSKPAAAATAAADAAASESVSKAVAFSSPITSSPPPRGANPSSKTTGGAAPPRRRASPIVDAPPPYDWTASVRNTVDAKLVSIGTLPVRPTTLPASPFGSPGPASPEKRRPRDRPFVLHLSPDTKDKTHLPPPLYPGVHGHGVVLGALAKLNPMAAASHAPSPTIAFKSKGEREVGNMESSNPKLLKQLLS